MRDGPALFITGAAPPGDSRNVCAVCRRRAGGVDRGGRKVEEEPGNHPVLHSESENETGGRAKRPGGAVTPVRLFTERSAETHGFL